MKNFGSSLILSTLLISFAVLPAFSQTSSFSYQGELVNADIPASGPYVMEFRLFDAPTAGSQVAPQITLTGVDVVDGVFGVILDFGQSAFPGADRFLEIAVRPQAGGPLETLSPRSQILSSPYAVRAKTVTGPVTGTSTGATLTVTNDQPGITDPQPNNLPPAALKGEATSTNDSNIGVLGVGNGTTGIGVLGVTSGNGGAPGGTDAIGVLGLATNPSGEAVGVSAQVVSPSGTAIEAGAGPGGFLFVGNSDESSSGNPKFVVTAAGQVRANAGVFARNFQLNSGNFRALENGNVEASGTFAGNVIEANTIVTTGNVNVGGTLNAANLDLGKAALNVASLTTSGDVNVGGTLRTNLLTPPGGTLQLGAAHVNTSGSGTFSGGLSAVNISTNTGSIPSLTSGQITSPNGLLQLGSTSVQTSGEGVFGFVRTSFLSGGNANVCFDSGGVNYLRFCSSSLRYKDKVRKFTTGLSIIKRLNPIAFRWKETGLSDIGLGAEDVAAVEPMLTFTNVAGEVEGVQYSQLNAVLVNAIKEQQSQIERQQAQIDALTRSVRRLSARKIFRNRSPQRRSK